jgi:hypothetical protein
MEHGGELTDTLKNECEPLEGHAMAQETTREPRGATGYATPPTL